MIAYSELDCISNFTFLRGASHPEELIQRAALLGYKSIALSDECSVSGVVRAHTAAQKHAIKLIIGSRFKITSHLYANEEIIILAANKRGYGNLCEFISMCRQNAKKGQYEFNINSILQPPSGQQHLASLNGCLIIYKPEYNPEPTRQWPLLKTLSTALPDRLWLGLALPNHHADQQHKNSLQELARSLNLPLVALGQAEMCTRSRQPLHDTLTAIRLKKPVTNCGYDLKPNAEHHLRSRLRLAHTYPANTLQQTQIIANLCSFSLNQIKYQYPHAIVPKGVSSTKYLEQEVMAGAHKRYPNGIPTLVLAQVKQELTIITELKYEAYFLTVYDIVRYARLNNILCQGRGSAANSAVCYCLGITEVDPESGNSLFARFISRERNEPPDIDVDFESKRREEVIQYVYRKYGTKHAALTAVVIRYKMRSAIRDTGKALGICPVLIEQVSTSCRRCNSYEQLYEGMLNSTQQSDKRTTANTNISLWAQLTVNLLGFPRHLSQHPGGFVISHKPLPRIVPIENAAMQNRTVVQWNKDDLDAMGMIKVDILGLGMLSALQRCIQLMRKHKNANFKLQDIPAYDAATFKMIQSANTIGVFQIESRAQMSMLPRLKPANFYDLVIQVAIVRPGPIQGGMVHPYLLRRQQKEQPDYPKPELKDILKRTLGVVIFQEQAMQVAMKAAGFSAEEADSLRRSMAAWHRNGNLNEFHDRLVQGMLHNGYEEKFANSLYKQLEGFGSYGFPESHAASFAKLVWISAWFKCHEPAVFLAALLNSLPMGFYSASQLIQNAKRNKVTVLPIDIQKSYWNSTLEPATNNSFAVRLGLGMVKNLSAKSAQRIANARSQGLFTSINNLVHRTQITQPELKNLAIANALYKLVPERRQAIWQASNPAPHALLTPAISAEQNLPMLTPMPQAQQLVADYNITGLSLNHHPMEFIRPKLGKFNFEKSGVLMQEYPDRRLARACGLVTVRQRPLTAKGTIFLTLEDEDGNINVIINSQIAQQQNTEVTQAMLMGVYGIWQRQAGVCHLLARRLVNLNEYLGNLKTYSRDFH